MHDFLSKKPLFSIGHSNQSREAFLAALKKHEVDVLVDVQSSPYSRYTPHFNREQLTAALKVEGTKYLFLGNELGGRPEGEQFYDKLNHIRSDGTVQTDEELIPREFQSMLFDAMEDDLWKFLRSVSQRRAPLSSSEF